MAFPPTRAAYEAIINEVKLLKEENKQLRNEIKETSRSTLEVELEPKTRDRKASRNSWATIYHNNTVRRKSMKLLGEDVIMDEWLDWRVKWGQRGVGILASIGLIFYIAHGGKHVVPLVIGVVWCYCNNICFYIVLQKYIIGDYETIVKRTQCCDHSHIGHL